MVSSPRHGRLENALRPFAGIQGFTRRDLVEGRVWYVHDGSESGGDYNSSRHGYASDLDEEERQRLGGSRPFAGGIEFVEIGAGGDNSERPATESRSSDPASRPVIGDWFSLIVLSDDREDFTTSKRQSLPCVIEVGRIFVLLILLSCIYKLQ